MMPVLSTRNSTLPALTSLIALATSIVTVPVLGFGIKPRGPRTLPRRPPPRISFQLWTYLNNLDAHATGSPFHRLNRSLETSRVQIRQFHPRDVFDLLLCDGPDFILVWLTRALRDIRCPFQQN